MPMNENFPVFVISLKSDIERREKIAKLLDDVNIDFEFFDAIDYRSDKFKSIINNASANSHAKYVDMTEPEMACTLSHLAVYQQIIDRNLQWALILEDDVHFDRRLSEVVHALSLSTSPLKQGCSYVLGGQQGTSDYQLFGLSLRHIVKIGGIWFRKVTYKKHKVTRTCSYIVDQKYCQQALKLFSSHGFYLIDDRKILFDNDVMGDIYFCDIVTHPLVNISNSHLELSRVNKNKGVCVKKRNVIIAYILSLRYRIRVFLGSFI